MHSSDQWFSFFFFFFLHLFAYLLTYLCRLLVVFFGLLVYCMQPNYFVDHGKTPTHPNHSPIFRFFAHIRPAWASRSADEATSDKRWITTQRP